jgi:hypothetical protein
MMSDDVFDDEESQKPKVDRESLVIQNVMKNEDGRSFIWGQLQSCGVFESIFDRDPIKHGYNAGLREGGLQLDRKVREAAPEQYVKMMQENING